MFSRLSFSHSVRPGRVSSGPRNPLPALDRRAALRMSNRCWWTGHRWSYRRSTQRVIIEFRQCERCQEVEVRVTGDGACHRRSGI